MAKCFGTLKESRYASDHTKFKKSKKCNTILNVNSANLINNLYTKENLDGVKVIELANPDLPLCCCKPIYENYKIPGTPSCNINNYMEYSLQKETVTSSAYGYNGPWPHFGGLYNNNNRLSTYLGSQTGNLAWTFISDQKITSTPAIDSSGNIYFSYYSDDGNTSTFMSVNSSGQTNWKIQNITGISISSPMIDVIGNVYFCTANTLDITGSIYLFSKAGVQKWQYDVEEQIYSSPSLDSRGNIYFGTTDTENNLGFFYSINFQGILNWKIDNYYSITTTTYYHMKQVFSSPALDNSGNIYFGAADTENNEGSLYSVNNCGKVIWRYDISGQIYSSSAIDSLNNIYFGSANSPTSYLYSLNNNGEYNWTYGVSGQIYSSPAIDSLNRVYFGTVDGAAGILYCIEANSKNDAGVLVWSYASGPIYSSPSIDSLGNVYFSDLTTLYALSSSQVLLWTSTIGTATSNSTVFTSSPSIGYDGTVFVGSNNGILYAYNNNIIPIIPNGYQVDSPWPHFGGINNFNTRRSIYSGSINKENVIHYGPNIGNITSSPVIDVLNNVYYCVNVFDGGGISSYLYKNYNLIFTFDVYQIILSTPIINYEGNIYICTSYRNEKSYLYNINSIFPHSIIWKMDLFSNMFIHSSPALDSIGNIYAIFFEQPDPSIITYSYLYSITSSGIINWRIKITGFSFSSPALDSIGNIYFTTTSLSEQKNSLYSVTSHGSFNTNFNNGNPVDASYSSTSSPSIDSSGNIYFISTIPQINPSDILYSYLYSFTSIGSFNTNFNGGVKMDFLGGCTSSTALDSCGNIYFSTYISILEEPEPYSRLYSIKSNGSLNTDFSGGYIQFSNTDTSQSSPTIDSYNNIFINSINISNQNIIYAYTSSGAKMWEYATTSGPYQISISSPSIGRNGTTYVGGIDGILYSFISK